MIISTNKTLESDIKKLLSDGKIVIVMSGNKQCVNCQLTRHNVMKFIDGNPTHRLGFISLDNIEHDKLESQYYQINELNEYPKTVIYYGKIENTGFNEGVITEQNLVEYNNSKRC